MLNDNNFQIRGKELGNLLQVLKYSFKKFLIAFENIFENIFNEILLLI